MANDIQTEYYNNAPREASKIKNKWWLEDDKDLHTHVTGIVKKICEAQSYRQSNNLRYARLYCNNEIMGLRPGQFAKEAKNLLTNRVTYNVIKACIDTAASKIAKNKPRPLFLTEDGSFTLQEKAKEMTQYMSGVFDQIGTGTGEDRTFYGIGRQCFVDSGIFGTGATKLYADVDSGEVKAERVMIDEIIIDDNEGMFRTPRQMFQRKIAHREVLIDLYPDAEKEILAAPSALDGEYSDGSSADIIYVIEAWHLPSGKGAKDGRRAVVIDTGTLKSSSYEKPYFPFLFQRWNFKPLGFFGQGIAEELIGIQLEINKMLRNMQIAQHLMAVPQVWLEIGSQTVTKQINNRIGGIKYYSGQPPKFFTPNAMSAEMYQHLERLYQRAFELVGISQLSATSKKPSGLDSGVALREYNDIESERFSLAGLRYEDYYIEGSYMIIDLSRDLVKAGKDPVVKIKENGKLKQVRFSQIDIPDDKVTIRGYPTNFLPSTPAGKLQKTQELIQAGFYSKEEALELLDYPDLEKVNRMKLAPRKDVQDLLETIIKRNEYIPPEPYMNLEAAKTIAQSFYMRAKLENMPDDKLDLIRTFMDDTKALIEKRDQAIMAKQAAAQGAMMPQEMQGVPTGQPAAPPTSELLPTA